MNFILSYQTRTFEGRNSVIKKAGSVLGFVKYNPDGTKAKLKGDPVKHEIPVEGDLVISGYCDNHDTKSLRIVSGGKEFVVGDHKASSKLSFHHSPKIAGARLRYISQRQHETKDAGVFKFHWEVAEEDNSPVIEDAGNRVTSVDRVIPGNNRVIPADTGALTRLKTQLTTTEGQKQDKGKENVVTAEDVKELVKKVRGNVVDKKEADQWLGQTNKDGTHHNYDLVDRVDWTEVSGWRDSGFIHVLENLHLGKALLKWHTAESKEKIDAEEEVKKCISKGGVTAYISWDEEDNKETFNQAKDAWNELHSTKCKFLLLSALCYVSLLRCTGR